MDGRDVLRLCGYDIAYEARLFDAIERGWLSPFQYFAIYDPTDYARIRWTGIGYDEADLERELSTDTRVEIIIRNLRRFLPSSGKTKALAFCANKGHAQYMTQQFTQRGVPAACLLGETPQADRESAMTRLADERDPLQVICSVDVLGEGADIPAVTHILLLRPTMSFTVFFQQIGCGLRKTLAKDFVVILDFVGNQRNVSIAALALRGFTSAEQYRNSAGGGELRLPDLCEVDVDTEVRRILEQDLRRTMSPLNREEVLRQTYRRMRQQLVRPLSLLDFVANPDACDPQAFLKQYGNWLRTKEAAGDLNAYESGLLGTVGEGFLEHIEGDLRAVRSYKMAVLAVLLATPADRTSWPAADIAAGFHKFKPRVVARLSSKSTAVSCASPCGLTSGVFPSGMTASNVAPRRPPSTPCNATASLPIQPCTTSS